MSVKSRSFSTGRENSTLTSASEIAAPLRPVSFSFFAPGAGRYQTITRGPVPLNVQAGEAAEEPRIVGRDIEPQRQVLIPGFKAVKEGAMTNGALGCSISGAGPTVFAWCEQQHAERVRDAMVAGFTAHNLASDAWISTLDPAGARILE